MTEISLTRYEIKALNDISKRFPNATLKVRADNTSGIGTSVEVQVDNELVVNITDYSTW